MNRKTIGTALAAGLMALAAGTVHAADVNAWVALSSAYVWRGITLNDGWVVQPGLEVSGLPVLIGVWANLDGDTYAHDSTIRRGEVSEVDFYGTYEVPIECMNLDLNYYEYTYPGRPFDADRWASVAAGLERPVGKTGVVCKPAIEAMYGLDGAAEKSGYFEGSVAGEYKVDQDWTATALATLGYVDSYHGPGGFSHCTASLGARYKFVHAGVTYVQQIEKDVLPTIHAHEAALGYDVKVYGTIGVSYGF